MWTCCASPAPSVAPAADPPSARVPPAPPDAWAARESARSRRTSDMPSPTRRGQGQWALGHREPLNAAERFKKDDDGLNVRERIINRYAHLGFDSIDPADLRGRFRWWGLYTQRRPGIGGGKTGSLDDAEIEDALLHDARPDPGRAAVRRAAAHGRGDRQGVRARPRRHHRPAERAVPLDPDRGRAGDLGAARVGGPVQPAGLRRRPAQHPRLPGGRHRRRRDPRRQPDAARRRGGGATNPEFTNLPRKYKTASAAAPPCAPRTRSTTSRSSASPARTGRPGSTCGWAAACPPTRCSPSGSACSSSRTRSLTCGRA